jgi:hypothetical protein
LPYAGDAAPAGSAADDSASVAPCCSLLPGAVPISAEKWRPWSGVTKRRRAARSPGGVTHTTKARVRGASEGGTARAMLWLPPSSDACMALHMAPERSSRVLPGGTSSVGCCQRCGEER